MPQYRLHGLCAAVYTPFDKDDRLNLSSVDPMVSYLKEGGVTGIYICGTTGEGVSLTTQERQATTEAYYQAASGSLQVVVQVGHNCLAESRQLAEHAQRIGVDAISANAPSYFKCGEVDTLVDCMATIASAAPDLPFYYYHIPSMTGASLDMVEFLAKGPKRIPNLAGIKYTETDLAAYQACVEFEGGRFDVPWGCDEMLIGALATGARGAIGSTYNIAAPLYKRIITAFEAGNWELARLLQSCSVNMVRTICQYPLHPAIREVLKMIGFDFGACRLPQTKLSLKQAAALRTSLEAIRFFDWAQATPESTTQEQGEASPIRAPHFSAEVSETRQKELNQ